MHSLERAKSINAFEFCSLCERTNRIYLLTRLPLHQVAFGMHFCIWFEGILTSFDLMSTQNTWHGMECELDLWWRGISLHFERIACTLKWIQLNASNAVVCTFCFWFRCCCCCWPFVFALKFYHLSVACSHFISCPCRYYSKNEITRCLVCGFPEAVEYRKYI